MAPKKAEKEHENTPPMVYTSEEEAEEYGSSGEESDSSREQKKQWKQNQSSTIPKRSSDRADADDKAKKKMKTAHVEKLGKEEEVNNVSGDDDTKKKVMIFGDVQNEKAVESGKETCVSSGDGGKNVEISEAVDQVEKDVSVEQLESNEGKMVDISAESDHYLEMEEEEDEASVTSAVKETPSVVRKKLLVLDINGLLADVVDSPAGDHKPDTSIGGRAIFKRPFVEEFLQFCFENFQVGIWSSRKKKNVERICDFLLPNMKSQLLFCWDMSYCATTNVGCPDNKNKTVVFKDLKTLWEIYGDYNETNTVLLDDSPYKALLNSQYTAIFPHSYNHQNKKTDTSLGDGGDLRVYLEKLVNAADVQDFIKKNPFGQEAITEASESWKIYTGHW